MLTAEHAVTTASIILSQHNESNNMIKMTTINCCLTTVVALAGGRQQETDQRTNVSIGRSKIRQLRKADDSNSRNKHSLKHKQQEYAQKNINSSWPNKKLSTMNNQNVISHLKYTCADSVQPAGSDLQISSSSKHYKTSKCLSKQSVA